MKTTTIMAAIVKTAIPAAAVFAVMALASVAAAGQNRNSKPTPVHGHGCVEAGVEARCLVVKEAESGTLYNLIVKGARPAIGTGIEFTGVPFDGMPTCMQGVALEVSAWARKDSLKCALPAAPAK